MAAASSTAAGTGAVAAAFVDARRNRTSIASYPGPLPAGEDEAYAIQQQAIALWGEAVSGWKVGLIPPPFSARLGRTRLFGPIFASAVQRAGSEPIDFPAIPGGFTAFEAEYVLAIAADVPPATGWTAERAASVVGAVHVGVEMAGSPFAGINDNGPLVTISDFGNNAGLLLGSEIAGGLAGLEQAGCSVAIDGREVGRGTPANIPGTPLESLAELLNHMGRTGQPLVAGTLVSTGAATGVHQVFAGQTAVADFGPHGRIAVRIVEG